MQKVKTFKSLNKRSPVNRKKNKSCCAERTFPSILHHKQEDANGDPQQHSCYFNNHLFWICEFYDGLTGELPEDSPQLGDVSGKGDVRVQDDDFGEVRGQSFG